MSLQRFINVSGGPDADIVVIPTASQLHETGHRYEQVFRDLGARRVSVMDFDTRRDCEEPSRLERLEQASGNFLHGRQPASAHHTRVALRSPSSSATATLMASRWGERARARASSRAHDRLGDEGAACAISGSVRPRAWSRAHQCLVIDQHFRERDRFGRLLTALAQPVRGRSRRGHGGVAIGPTSLLEVEGTGGVTVVDAADVTYSSMDSIAEDQPLCMLGLKGTCWSPARHSISFQGRLGTGVAGPCAS